MEKYEAPVMDIEEFEDDAILTSGDNTPTLR